MPENGASHRLPTDRVFDVVVIGGGITGAWTALDCTLRGLSTLLVEKGDFGGATSMRSSRLLHGGIRYLQQLEFGKVRESARERHFLTRSAPHLVQHVPFVVPTYRNLRQGRAFLYSGMLAYRILTVGCQGARAGSGCVSRKRPSQPAATAARTSAGMCSGSPPLDPAARPGR